MRSLSSVRGLIHGGALLCVSLVPSLIAPAPLAARDNADAETSPHFATQQVGPWRSAAWAGIEIGRVSASGSGCPSGSWWGQLSDDGQRFYIRFTAFEPEITPRQSAVSANCRLTIDVHVPAGLSYQLRRLSYLGYAYLEHGVSADVTANYYFQNDRANTQTVRTTLTGPFDDIYTIEDQPKADGMWSPCGRRETQTLNVQLTVALKNGSPPRDGTLELNEALGIELGYRRCQ